MFCLMMVVRVGQRKTCCIVDLIHLRTDNLSKLSQKEMVSNFDYDHKKMIIFVNFVPKESPTGLIFLLALTTKVSMMFWD